MSDLTLRLRSQIVWEPEVGELLEEAAREIEKLQSLVRFQDRVIRSGDVACLTSEERRSLDEAIEEFRERGNLVADQIAENLHRLTERLK